ncbi:hypothetical protein [Terribacillus sp. DMT04]|uniref:hypothetical protein n=1 Tax=Terribacillus sp. DMT04 TaxID=2850441 RepID=UPI001C2BB994|nr:hypothetical protein [Terribacillus sp. DMT04]QXE02333.1 hypothetical protein KS242_03645 [Terribacillus sp. DMT04]
MGMELTEKEKMYLDDISRELITRKAKKEQVLFIKQQLLEHIEESRLHGIDPFDDLETPAEFVTEYCELNEVQFVSPQKASFPKSYYFIGLFSFTVTYLLSQLILTMCLTQTFSPAYQHTNFNYNLLYSISDNLWWNSMLISISLISAAAITSLTVLSIYRKGKFIS